VFVNKFAACADRDLDTTTCNFHNYYNEHFVVVVVRATTTDNYAAIVVVVYEFISQQCRRLKIVKTHIIRSAVHTVRPTHKLK